MYNTMKHFLPTGFGVSLDKDNFELLTSYQVRMLLIKKGFVILSNTNLDDEDAFRKLVATYGTVVQYSGEKEHVGYGFKDLLKLNGERDKIISGRGELPIHSDGGLLQARVDIVFLYATKIEKMKFQGETILFDHELAYYEMPQHLKRILDEETFESRVLEEGYYVDASPKGWFTVPVHNNYGWGSKMLLYFPFTGDNPPSWESRIHGFTEKEIKNFFEELNLFFYQPRYCYKHYWKKGNLMIMDNRRVLHARKAFDNNSERIIYRGQTIDPEY